MKNLTEVKIQEIMKPLKAAEFEARYRTCSDCDGDGKIAYMVTRDESDIETCEACEGQGYLPQHEPDDGSEAGL